MSKNFAWKHLLVTGGAGFVGSNLAISFKNKYPNTDITVFDNLKRRGSEINISRLRDHGISFIHGDIRNQEDLEKINAFDVMIECSAEPSVLSGYGESPLYLLNANLVGAINCFELARRFDAAIIFMSTSRVYPYKKINEMDYEELETRYKWVSQKKHSGFENGIDINFPLSGFRSMYGASKLSAEYILAEYSAMYGIKSVINRCGVIAGPWQFGKVDQGVFTLWAMGHYFERKLKYIGYEGKGKQVRDLLHVDDLFDVIEIQLIDLEKYANQIFDIGGGYDISLSLLETTNICQKILGKTQPIEGEIKDRPADLRIYITSNKKFTDLSGWRPQRSAQNIIHDIFSWIESNEKSIISILD